MLKGYQIIDADSHVLEPHYMWRKYVEPAYKCYAPSEDLKVEGEEIFYKCSAEVRDNLARHVLREYPISVLNRFDSASQVRAMKHMGVDISFIYPTMGLWLLAIDTMTPQLAGAFTRAYNKFLKDFCSYEPQILKGVGAINLHAPEEMITELRRIDEFGWKAVYLRPNPVDGRLLSDPSYEDFWSECERLGIAVSIHEGTHCRLPSTGADRFNTRFALHACSHPMEQMMAMLALIEGGVLERHPNLRVSFLEAGCGWLPYWLWRLDEEYKNLAWEVKENVKMEPSNYFKRQCFISIDPEEPYLEKIIEYIGSDNLIFGSDYPHVDHGQDMTEKVVALQERLPKKTVQAICWDNSVRFYGLT